MKKQYEEAYENLLILGWVLAIAVFFVLIMSVYEGELERERDNLRSENNFLKDFIKDEGYLFQEDYYIKGKLRCKSYRIDMNSMIICKKDYDAPTRKEVTG